MPPSVSTLTTAVGPTSGATSTTVNGSGFTGVTAVNIVNQATGLSRPARSFTFVSDSQILLVTPAQIAGLAAVEVTTPGGTSAVVFGSLFLYEAVFDMPTVSIEAAFAKFATGGFVWSDLSAYQLRISTKSGKDHELDRFQPGTLDLTFDNTGGPFSVFNEKSPFYNMLHGDDADFEGGLGTWAAFAHCSLSQSTAQASYGSHSMAVLCAGGGDATCQTSPSLYAVTPGTSYAATVNFFIPSGTARMVEVGISWYDASHTYLSTSTGSSTSEIPGTWVQAIISVAAPANAAFGQVVVTIVGPSAAEVHFVDAAALFNGPLQQWVPGAIVDAHGTPSSGALVPMVPIKVTASWDGVTYPLGAGFVDEWKPIWPEPTVSGYMQVTASDALKALNQISLTGVDYKTMILNEGPSAYYPCDDAMGATSLSDASTNNQSASLVNTCQLSGRFTPLYAYGSGARLSDPSAGNFFTYNNLGYAVCPASLLSGAHQASFEMWVQLAADSTLLSTFAGFRIFTSGGQLNAEFDTFIGGSLVVNGHGGPTTLTDSHWHHVVVTAVAPGYAGNIVGYVDGVQVFSVASTGTWSGDFSLVYIGGTSAGHGLTYGYFQDIAIWNSLITSAQVTEHYNAALLGWPTTYTGPRVSALLALFSKFIGTTTVDTGTCGIQAKAMDPTPTSVLSNINVVLDTDEARFWQDLAGNVFFRQRNFTSTNSRSTSVQVTFNDQGILSGVQYATSSPDLTVDDTDLWNEAVVSAYGLPTATATNAASVAEFQTRVVQRSTFHTVESDVTAHASYLVGKYAWPIPRPQELVVDLLTEGIGVTVLPYVLGLQFYDLVEIVRHFQDGGGTYDQKVFVEGIDHDIVWAEGSEASWKATVRVSGIG